MLDLHDIKSYKIRKALSAGCAVLIAAVVNYFYAFSHEYWVTLSAFLVCQTTRGTSLRQALNIFLMILIALFFASLMQLNISQHLLSYFIAFVFIMVAMVILKERVPAQTFYLLLVFVSVFLIASLSPNASLTIEKQRIIDVIIGTLIGILCTQIILFANVYKEFRKGLLPLLTALITYSQSLCDVFLGRKGANSLLTEKIQVERSLQSDQGPYPGWVYEVGFNPGLRASFRFFLINLERVVELFFSINSLLTCYPDMMAKTNGTLGSVVSQAMKKNQELLNILLNYFANNEIKKTTSDFTSDIAELEETLQKVVPSSLELLDISPEYIAITGFVRDIKDMRGLLLQLVGAVPTS